MMGPSLAIVGSGGGIGTPGKSAYQLAVDNGFVGTVEEWLVSLKGADGSDFAVQYDNNVVDLGPVRMAWGSADSVLGVPETFLFPEQFAAPPVVQITRQSQGTALVPQNVTTDGFTIHRGELLANPIPFQWQATGLKPDSGVVAPEIFDIPGLPTWSAAVRAQKAGKRNARIMCVGDSTTMGYGSNGTTFISNDRAGSYPTQLAALLTARGSKGSWQSWIGNGNTGANQQLYDNRISKGASWGDSSVATAGGFSARTSGTPTTFSFTPTEAWDTAEVYVYKGDATSTQSVNVSIDGALKASVSTYYFDQTNGNSDATIVTADAVGSHVLGITAAVSGVAHVLGAITYNSSVKEVTVLNAGWGGATAAAWIAGMQTLAPVQMIKSYSPDLVIINLGINDGTPTDPLLSKAQFQKQLMTIIDAARNSGADIMLVAPNDGSPADFGARIGVLGVAMAELATINSLPFIDLRTKLGTWAQANSAGYMRDAVHPNASGYAEIATAIADVIMPVGA